MKRSRSTSKLALLAAAALAIVAALAIAVPAAAHRDGEGFGGDPAGTIASFDQASGKLVIDLTDGGSISGLVTRFTWIDSDADRDCDHARSAQRRQVHGWCRRLLHDFGPGGDHGWGHDSRGSADDLVVGATVEDALLVLKDGRAFYAKVELDG